MPRLASWKGSVVRLASIEATETMKKSDAFPKRMQFCIEFVAGDEHTYGKILSMFQINVLLPGKAAVSIFLVLVCLEIVFPLGVVFLLAHFYLIICSYYLVSSIIECHVEMNFVLFCDVGLGVWVLGRRVLLLLYADDIVLLARSAVELQAMLDVVTVYAQ
jgi:hypothetical protein